MPALSQLAVARRVAESLWRFGLEVPRQPELAAGVALLEPHLAHPEAADQAFRLAHRSMAVHPHPLVAARAACALYARLSPDDRVLVRHKYVSALRSLAALEAKRGNLTRARRAFERSLQLKETSTALHGLGFALLGSGWVDEAVRCWRRRIELEPRDHCTRWLLSDLLRIQGEYREAQAVRPAPGPPGPPTVDPEPACAELPPEVASRLAARDVRDDQLLFDGIE